MQFTLKNYTRKDGVNEKYLEYYDEKTKTCKCNDGITCTLDTDTSTLKVTGKGDWKSIE